MKFVVSKVIEASDSAADLAGLLAQGFKIETLGQHAANPANAVAARATGIRRKRRRRAPMKVTPALVREIAALRKKGLVWRIIGKRFGVSAGRAWQIANTEVKAGGKEGK